MQPELRTAGLADHFLLNHLENDSVVIQVDIGCLPYIRSSGTIFCSYLLTSLLQQSPQYTTQLANINGSIRPQSKRSAQGCLQTDTYILHMLLYPSTGTMFFVAIIDSEALYTMHM